jgi:hypothetical protein
MSSTPASISGWFATNPTVRAMCDGTFAPLTSRRVPFA